jgi:hypothetical protein
MWQKFQVHKKTSKDLSPLARVLTMGIALVKDQMATREGGVNRSR